MPTALPMLNLHCPREVTLVEAKVVMFVLTTTEFLELKQALMFPTHTADQFDFINGGFLSVIYLICSYANCFTYA